MVSEPLIHNKEPIQENYEYSEFPGMQGIYVLNLRHNLTRTIFSTIPYKDIFGQKYTNFLEKHQYIKLLIINSAIDEFRLDSEGFEKLIGLYLELKKKGGEVVFSNINSKFKSLIRQMFGPKLAPIKMYKSIDEAVQDFILTQSKI